MMEIINPACDYDLTVEHIPIKCGDFAEVKQRHYDAESLRQQFQEISIIKVHVFEFCKR